MCRLALLCLLSALSVSWAKPRLPLLSPEMVQYINTADTTWTAGQNFHNVDISYVKSLCGTLLKGPRLPELVQSDEDMSLPDSFDARLQWPNCPTIKEIRDQGSCGSCLCRSGACPLMTASASGRVRPVVSPSPRANTSHRVRAVGFYPFSDRIS